jgi:hypothetical protein
MDAIQPPLMNGEHQAHTSRKLAIAQYPNKHYTTPSVLKYLSFLKYKNELKCDKQ